jgi:methionine-rich copper-binding protein CopC
MRPGKRTRFKICEFVCGAAGVACIFALVQPVWAHAILLESTPAKNATVVGPSLSVELLFNCRIDGKRSRLTLVLPNQALRPLAIQPQSSPDKLNAQEKGFEPGTYRLRWQVLASDGHITRGEIPFLIR